MATSDLEVPVLLVAMPQVLDPFFHKSVVLLIHHDDEGSLGLILNRATGIEVAEILRGMEIEWEGPTEAMAHFGGPVQPQLGTVLYRSAAGCDEATTSEIHPELMMTQHIGNLTDLAGRPPEFFRLVLGYAGWGEGQLLGELLRNDWLTVPVAGRLLFETPVDGLWAAALRSVDVDPDSLPACASNGTEEAN